MAKTVNEAAKKLRDALVFDGGACEGVVYTSVIWQNRVTKAIEELIDAKIKQLNT